MIKNLGFQNLSISSHYKKWYIREISLNSWVENIPTHLILSLTRPKVDEDSIRKMVTVRFAERLKDSLFSEAVRNEIEEESKQEIALTRQRFRELPNPIIFEGRLSEYKDKMDTKIVVKVSKDVWIYLFKSHEIDKLLLNIDTYPDYIRWAEEVKKIVEEFEKENEDYLDTKKLLK